MDNANGFHSHLHHALTTAAGAAAGDPPTVDLALDWPRLADAIGQLGRTRVVVANDVAWSARCLDFSRARFTAQRLRIQESARRFAGEMLQWSRVVAVAADDRHPPHWTVLRVLADDGAVAWEMHPSDEQLAPFQELVRRFAVTAPVTTASPVTVAIPTERPNDDLDIAALRAAWDGMRGDPVRRVAAAFGVSCGQLLRLVGHRRAERVAASGVQTLLAHAMANQRQITLQVSNATTRFASECRPLALRAEADWLEVRGSCAQLHLRTDAVVTGWMVAAGLRARAGISFQVLDANDAPAYAVALTLPSQLSS